MELRDRAACPDAPSAPGPGGLADIALCAILSCAGLRRSEATSHVWGDGEASATGSGALRLRRSETDPGWEGSARYLPRGTAEALVATRPENANSEDAVFGLSGR